MWLTHLLIKPWTAQEVITPCSSRTCLTDPDLLYCGKPFGCSAQFSILGPHGQGSSDDNRNTRRRLDTFSSPEDEHAQKCVLLRFPCEQYREEGSAWIKSFSASTNATAINKPTRIHCKTGSMSARLVFETRAKCQDFVARFKDDGIPHEVNSLFLNAKTIIAVRQSKSFEDRETGKQFAPLWKVLAEHLKVLFPEGDDTGAFIIPALDVRSQVLSIKDRSNGIGKPVFKLPSLGIGQLFTIVAHDLSVPGVPDEVLQRVISQASQLAQNGAAHVFKASFSAVILAQVLWLRYRPKHDVKLLTHGPSLVVFLRRVMELKFAKGQDSERVCVLSSSRTSRV